MIHFSVILIFIVASNVPSHFHVQDSEEIVQCGCSWLYDIHLWKWCTSRALIPWKKWKFLLPNQWWQVHDKDHEEGWSKSTFFCFFTFPLFGGFTIALNSNLNLRLEIELLFPFQPFTQSFYNFNLLQSKLTIFKIPLNYFKPQFMLNYC